jgi:hypothetical protein
MFHLNHEQKVALASLAATVVGTTAAVVMIPEFRDWSCPNYGYFCKKDGDKDKDKDKDQEKNKVPNKPPHLDEADEAATLARQQKQRELAQVEEDLKTAQLKRALLEELDKRDELARRDKEKAQRDEAAKSSAPRRAQKPVVRNASLTHGDSPLPATGYSANAYCSATGARGASFGLSTPQLAMQVAAADCVRNGGIPACCQNGTSLGTAAAPRMQPRTFSAIAYCSLTGARSQARDLPSPDQALAAAVLGCIGNGGVPQCCQHGAQLVP